MRQRALEEQLRTIAEAVGETRQHVLRGRQDTESALRRLERLLADLAQRVQLLDDGRAQERARIVSAIQAGTEGESARRADLARLRADAAYELAFTEPDPLVSIVIPTFDNVEALCERAIPSALEQTHEHIEVIVVGDCSPAALGEAVARIGDARVRFENLPYRGPYPDDPQRRWLVAGVPPFNAGVRLAAGRWIAPLDDDDAFFADHVEQLLRHARERRSELAYGLIREHRPDGTTDRLGRFPPEPAQFGLQAAIYHAGLAGIFELELADSEWEEPYDWGLCRRMMRAGVRMSMLDQEVVHYYPSRLWMAARREDFEAQRDAQPAPELELAREGWSTARESERASGQGWDVAAVAAAYARKWPEFIERIHGTAPLGVGHEVREDEPMRRDDPLAQNTILAFGHVLALAARHRDALSVLDWGGALGHYHELARRLMADIELDYHCRELPAVCEQGRGLSPAVRFHDTDDCLATGPYDLVMASGSLQYEEDWAKLLRRLAAAAAPWLYVTRLPIARHAPTFAMRQRAHAYGYDTEYVGWVINHEELLAVAAGAGLELVREYVLAEPIPIAGAPEAPPHVGLLFRRGGAQPRQRRAL